MAIHDVSEMWSTETGNMVQEGKKITRVFRSAYQVLHDAGEPRQLIERAAGIPRIGDPYKTSTYVRAKNVGSISKGPILSIVSVDFQGEVDRDDENKSPVSFKPDISWGDATGVEPIDEDVNGKPIVTATGEPIDGVTADINDPVVTIKKNFLSFNSYLMYEYRRSTNSDTFLGYPPGMARMIQYSADMNYYDDTQAYWEVTAQIQFRITIRTTPERAWWKRVRHEGYYCYVDNPFSPGNLIKVRARDENNEPTTRPVLLKADGTQETDPTKAHWLEFQIFKSLPFQALGLLT